MGNVNGVTVLKKEEVCKKTASRRCEDLTGEEVRAGLMFSKCSEDEVQEIIRTVKRFSRIVYDCYQKTKARQDQDAESRFK